MHPSDLRLHTKSVEEATADVEPLRRDDTHRRSPDSTWRYPRRTGARSPVARCGSPASSGSEKNGRRLMNRPVRPVSFVSMPIDTSSCGRSTGSVRRRTEFTSWKIAALAPVPSASVRIATIEKVGFSAQQPQSVAEVLRDGFDEAQRIHVVDFLADQRGVAELAVRGMRGRLAASCRARCCRRSRARDSLRSSSARSFVPPRRGGRTETSPWDHSAGRRIRLIARTISSQRLVCSASCDRPFGVSR